ncbi:hypothetical protein J5N97_000578 [Dioscorea zingiberensis]|uniref:CobW C-terminal domain-containing protein n=1 Tax=Dioscorea zingiberensis TaxID=325984 RepID=A0A9D5BS41_9LILI|nr:hypothetical protein J5N97_000578 [Dioscorea zingiberensis]
MPRTLILGIPGAWSLPQATILTRIRHWVSILRVPATIITGFLGSGKTTLLNHILTSQHGKRIAVIENEFGEVDIDGSLVASHSSSNEDIVMVNNGCLCCTVRGDLVKMLLQLVKEKQRQPSPVIETFCMDELVSRHVKLDGVVTLVDCKHAMQHLNEVKPRFVVNEAVEQVAYADRIILNKELETLTKKNQAKFGSVDMDFVLGFKSIVPVLPSHHHEAGHEHDNHHHDHVHDSTVSSVSIVTEGTLDLDEDLYRMKGVLCVNGSDQRYVFQGVHSTLDGCPGGTWGPDEKRINKLVFIGRNLDETSLRKGFRGCIA